MAVPLAPILMVPPLTMMFPPVAVPAAVSLAAFRITASFELLVVSIAPVRVRFPVFVLILIGSVPPAIAPTVKAPPFVTSMARAFEIVSVPVVKLPLFKETERLLASIVVVPEIVCVLPPSLIP